MNVRFAFQALCLSLCIGVATGATSHATVPDPVIPDPLTTIELSAPVYFVAPDGSSLVASPGAYTTEAAEDWIRLVPGDRHDAVLIEATKSAHALELPDALALSVAGTQTAHQDLHHIILLLPDGHSLEATGTYSGIRPRNVFNNAINNAKKTANQAYKKARSTARKAATTAKKAANKATSTAKKAAEQTKKRAQQGVSHAKRGAQHVQQRARQGVQQARNAALRAKQQVEQAGRRAASTIKNTVQQGVDRVTNNPLTGQLPSEIQMLDAVRKLKLESLFQCLSKTSGQGSANVPHLVQQFVNNPPAFANTVISTMMRQWEKHFREIMSEQLQILKTASGSPLQPAQVIDMAMRSMEKLAKKTPVGKCMLPFARPHMQNARNTSVRLQRDLMAQARRMFDQQVAPILFAGLSQQLGKVLKAVVSLTPRDLARLNSVRSRGIAAPESMPQDLSAADQIVSRGAGKNAPEFLKDLIPGLGEIVTTIQAVLADRLLNPTELFAAASQLHTLAKPGLQADQQQAVMRKLRTMFDPKGPWTEALYIDIGMEILRTTGKLYLHSSKTGGGTWLVRKGVGLIGMTGATVGNVAQGAAGLVPEAGSWIAALVREGPDVVLDLVVSDLIEDAAIGAAQFAFNKVVDEAKHALKHGRPYQSFKDRAGPLKALLRVLPSKQQVVILADTHTEDVRKALEQYHRGVLALAGAVVR